jgi:sigma-B regulation protein RsbU (phosphoserine phosphatase)
MYSADTQLTASQVLRTFHRDELYIFLGASFTTVGLVAGAFGILRRKVDPLLAWFALFAILYGQRLWLNTGLLTLMLPPSDFFDRLRASANYLIPIPASFYFAAAGFLDRSGQKIAYALSTLFLSLVLGTIVFGPLWEFSLINNIVIVSAVGAMVIRFARSHDQSSDFKVIRRGLFVFAAFVVAGNLSELLGHFLNIEPVGFAFFLGTLGVVAARRTVQRDQEFAEVQKELEVARRIQLGNLPPAFSNSASFRVASRYVPMTSVAGDFYDFVVADDDQAGIMIADVSGHGIPAALIASMVKLAVSSQRSNAANPAALLTGMNAALCGNTQNQFVTAAYVHLDAAAGKFSYSAAAHPPMLMVRDGKVVEIVENGLMLAAFSFADFTTAVHELRGGDRFLLYTDGIVEAADEKQEEFGQERLQALLVKSAKFPAEDAAELIIESVQRWSKSQDDDLTVIVCDYAGAEAE